MIPVSEPTITLAAGLTVKGEAPSVIANEVAANISLTLPLITRIVRTPSTVQNGIERHSILQ